MCAHGSRTRSSFPRVAKWDALSAQVDAASKGGQPLLNRNQEEALLVPILTCRLG